MALPYLNNGTISHHPNYRLGRLAGSPCDTLTFPTDVAEPVSVKTLPALTVSPNPAQTQVRISGLPTWEVPLTLTDISGRVRMQQRVVGVEAQLDLRKLPSGVYFVRVMQDGSVSTRQLIIHQ